MFARGIGGPWRTSFGLLPAIAWWHLAYTVFVSASYWCFGLTLLNYIIHTQYPAINTYTCALLTLAMLRYLWIIAWLLPYMVIDVTNPPMINVQNVLRTVGSTLKLNQYRSSLLKIGSVPFTVIQEQHLTPLFNNIQPCNGVTFVNVNTWLIQPTFQIW